MASAVFHAVAALALGAVFRPGFGPDHPPYKYWVAGVLCSVLPDADGIGFVFGVPYGSLFGHRGFTHSLLFAALLGAGTAFAIFREDIRSGRGWRIGAYLMLAAASHGLLDALTNGGLGVAFFSPFDTTRYFFPFHPVAVSPINPARFLEARGLRVLASECLWIGAPALALAAGAEGLRRFLRIRGLHPRPGSRADGVRA